ncbi:hypothetical protein [Methylobacterium indicum]|uniref:Cytochrome c family protein n=1 Tax=Methylobacterium indicum TaxID=1775910 RepID=A0A8H9CAA4_9HYPH|nr:hypothetical protein [Methylobacterium indicum]BCM87601.1 hypothetical protein mvi_60620 [Methylobacterium indicum]
MRRSHLSAVGMPLLGLVLAASGPAAAQQQPDYSKLTPAVHGRIPRVVPAFPFSAIPRETRPMFDQFLWQNFIAIMWPSRPQDLGEPYRPDDPEVWRRGYVDGLQPAFLGWKTAADLYPGNGDAPPAWDEASRYNPCRDRQVAAAPSAGPMILARTSKFGTIADEVDQAFAGPLIDQTGLLTRYEVRVNRAEYDYIRGKGYYNRSAWPSKPQDPPISFPQSTPDRLGAVEVKAAWRDLSRVDPKFHTRFFTARALAVEANSCKTTNPLSGCACKEVTVGLVGFHVAHKTEQFPQWVWGTFEQVDNLGEDPSMPAGMTPSYYDGTRANPPQHPGYSYEPGNAEVAASLSRSDSANGAGAGLKPVNVARLSAIPSTPATLPTTTMNANYRSSALKGTVWANYWLIGTQWSTLPSWPAPSPFAATYPGAPPADFGCEDGTPAAVGGLAFPACQVANITMETYHQYDSCQNCHQGAQRFGADFSWSLFQRAYDPTAKKATADQPVIRRRPD